MALAALEGISLEALAERVRAGLELTKLLGDTPVLVLHVAEGDDDPLYATPADGVAPVFAHSQTSRLLPEQQPAPPEQMLRTSVVVPLTPSNRNLYHDRVLIGRGASNDIRLTSTQVSKVHAHFRKNHAEQWVVEDEGSSNGTRLNGERLEPGEPMRVRPSDQLVFSDVMVMFLDAQGLSDLCELFIDR